MNGSFGKELQQKLSRATKTQPVTVALPYPLHAKQTKIFSCFFIKEKLKRKNEQKKDTT